MNSQTPTPDDGQPTEPLPKRENEHLTEPLLPPASPSASDQNPEPESTQDSTQDYAAQDSSGGPTAGPSAGPYSSQGTSSQSTGSYAYTEMPSQQTDFFGWIRSHGITRGQDRWIGGVSSGIAQRLGIDPLIVRGVFIVLTLFAGIGVLAYGLAWAFLPEPDGRIHVQEAGAGRWTGGMTGSLIAVILGFSGLGGGFWGWGDRGFGAFLWTVFWVGGAIYLIYYLAQRNKAAVGTPASAAGPGMASYPGSTAYPGTNAYSAAATAGTTPPYSDVAGTGPFTGSPYGGAGSGGGWNNGGAGGTRQPQGPPPAPKVRPAGPGTPAVAIAAGSALLVGAGLKALDVTNIIDLGDSTNAIAWASAAAVLGLGILILGLRGRTAGILSFFAVAALIIGGIFNVVGNNGDRVRFQQVDWTPTSIGQASDGLNITAGRGTVDLTELALATPLQSDVVVPLDFTASNVTVVIPDTVPVDIRADMTLGNLTEGGSQRGGTTTRESSYNTDKPGSHLVIQIDGTVSNVTIKEGN
ncbi:phage shock protein PspC (stress-responsive transcriptional regulator) [Arthrobacter sp. V1I9]|uniref:PspC domain-containing protein n=1 Tax=Arthrobacter sp. V1I9 TaxID=3042275 RepID=UPI0027924A71|nr:PspC domain-containing protein [Arthrobacter sp. V1I9]MDQ0868493.1 phage shock protein PspC (stress-responsive transcriptional regulator) [Arthrobacter sp. V1I9]